MASADITTCAGCNVPAHASETDDDDRCAACRLVAGPYPAGPYRNTECDRRGCNNAKPAGTKTLWCLTCCALPTCDECGEPLVDCYAGRGGYPCVDRGGMDDAALRQHERRQLGIGG